MFLHQLQVAYLQNQVQCFDFIYDLCPERQQECSDYTVTRWCFYASGYYSASDVHCSCSQCGERSGQLPPHLLDGTGSKVGVLTHSAVNCFLHIILLVYEYITVVLL